MHALNSLDTGCLSLYILPMQLIERARRSLADLFRPESDQERTARIEGVVSSAGLEIKEEPELAFFSERYGNLAGHALVMARMSRGTIYSETRRGVNASAARVLTSALERNDFVTAEAGFRLMLDLGTGVALPAPPDRL